MGVYSLLLRKGVDFRTRFQALLNLLCTLYMIVLVLVVTSLGFFHIVPTCYWDNPSGVFLHRLSIAYCFLSCVSQYATCIYTDTSVTRESRDKPCRTNKKQSNGEVLENSPTEDTTSQSNHISRGKDKCGRPTNAIDKPGVKKRFGQTNDANGKSPNREGTGKPGSEEQIKKDKGISTRKQIRRKPHKNEFFCATCQLYIPDRVHHCYLCETCIEKRDHHCFFMGVCIGQTNQKYFIFFTLFMGTGTMYGLAIIAKYLHVMYGIQFNGPQTFVTLFAQTVLNVFTGRTPSPDFMIHFFCMYASLFGTMFALSFFAWQLMIVYYGQTTYESKCGITKFSKATVIENVKDVFGKSFLASFCSLVIPFADLATQ